MPSSPDTIVYASLAPLYRDPNPRSEQVSQMVLGEIGFATEHRGEWIAIRRELDDYVGWTHQGYVRVAGTEETARWLETAVGRADGARLRLENAREIVLPLMARLAPVASRWMLPDGTQGTLIQGAVTPAEMLTTQARMVRAFDWAMQRYSAAPYQWGGITPWGVDCSGLVQTTFGARGMRVPRDSNDQRRLGAPVNEADLEPDDLLFFGDSADRITHVAMFGEGTLVHSTIACGGFVVEPWKEGARAWTLRPKLQGIRRLK
jgi:hypothetical protein